jgi:hypothetical protein
MIQTLIAAIVFAASGLASADLPPVLASNGDGADAR